MRRVYVISAVVLVLMGPVLFRVVFARVEETHKRVLTIEEEAILREAILEAEVEDAVAEDANAPDTPGRNGWQNAPRFAVSSAGCRNLAEISATQIIFAKFDLRTAKKVVLENDQEFYLQYYLLVEGAKWTKKPKRVRAGTEVLADAEGNMVLTRCCNGLLPPGVPPPPTPPRITVPPLLPPLFAPLAPPPWVPPSPPRGFPLGFLPPGAPVTFLHPPSQSLLFFPPSPPIGFPPRPPFIISSVPPPGLPPTEEVPSGRPTLVRVFGDSCG